MAQFGALISGSFALQFFERSFWPSSDLDIYVEDSQEGTESLGEYLEKSEGYSLESVNENWVAYNSMGDPVTDSFTRVQIITTQGPPIATILRSFYTTVVVNIISWNKAYSVFPLITLIQYRGYLLKYLDEVRKLFVTKYSQRGWRIQEILWPEDHQSNHPIRQYRMIGDRFSWMIPLNVGKVRWSQTPDYVLEHASFCIDGLDYGYLKLHNSSDYENPL
ncbi:MAG: hypothetical protein Q9221_003201 [Calogaya cf. arnoldii]